MATDIPKDCSESLKLLQYCVQFPQQQSQVSQQPLINSAGNALMTSATPGLGQTPEGLVANAQTSVPPNMGLNLSGVNTGSHNMPVLPPMDQTDNAAAVSTSLI